MPCKNCGSPKIFACKRCSPCYQYYWQHAEERPRHLIERHLRRLNHTVTECLNCHSENIYALGRCPLCYKYFKKHGVERPAVFWLQDNLHPPIPYQDGQRCLNCGWSEIFTAGRCSACYLYLKKNNIERPEHLWPRLCDCKKNLITTTIRVKIRSASGFPAFTDLPVCEECARLEGSL